MPSLFGMIGLVSAVCSTLTLTLTLTLTPTLTR